MNIITEVVKQYVDQDFNITLFICVISLTFCVVFVIAKMQQDFEILFSIWFAFIAALVVACCMALIFGLIQRGEEEDLNKPLGIEAMEECGFKYVEIEGGEWEAFKNDTKYSGTIELLEGTYLFLGEGECTE